MFIFSAEDVNDVNPKLATTMLECCRVLVGLLRGSR